MSAPFLVSTTLCGPEGVATIGEALASIAPHVDAVLVIVTTLTDTAATTIREAADAAVNAAPNRPGLGFRLWSWRDDFGAARNAALDFAAELGATWCVWVDSDETIEGADEIRPFLAAQPADVRAVMMPHASGSYYQPRAIRLPCSERWAGRVHEAISLTGPRVTRARFCDRPKSAEQMRAKRRRDLLALGMMTTENPREPRWWFYFGDAVAGLMASDPLRGGWEKAVEAFGRCADLPGWDEQAAWAAYRAAEILTSVLGEHDRAVEMCARGLARHAGIAELAWMAALASYRAGRYEQALHWSKLADVHGAPGLGGDGRALRSRVLFREPKGLTFGPAEVREHALRALGEHQAAERAKRVRELRIDAPICNAVDGVFGPDVGPVCTEPPGHEGDHVADDPATGEEVSRWASDGRKRYDALAPGAREDAQRAPNVLRTEAEKASNPDRVSCDPHDAAD